LLSDYKGKKGKEKKERKKRKGKKRATALVVSNEIYSQLLESPITTTTIDAQNRSLKILEKMFNSYKEKGGKKQEKKEKNTLTGIYVIKKKSLIKKFGT